jgi:hypothetical protein
MHRKAANCRRFAAKITNDVILIMRKSTEEQTAELQRMRDRSLTILAFMRKHNAGIPFLLDQTAAIIEQTFANGNLRGMRHVVKDFREWALAMKPDRLAELNEELQQRFGETLK